MDEQTDPFLNEKTTDDLITANKKLHIAARKGSVEEVESSLRMGAQVNVVNEYGQTPLYMAVSGFLEILKSEAEYKALKKSNSKEAERLISKPSWITQSALQCYADKIEILCQHNAEIKAADHNGVTPFELSRQIHDLGHPQIYNYFNKIIENGGKTQIKTKPRNNYSHEALLKAEISRFFSEKENFFDDIFEVRGIYTARLFPIRHDQRNKLLKEIENLLNSKDDFNDILRKLIELGEKAQKHHETVSGTRWLGCGPLIHKTCGFKKAVNQIILNLGEDRYLNEKSLLLRGSYSQLRKH